jgi:DMSO/TMAO reductase YedYZ molybdopterin-dependent catalytic subunit
VLLVGVALYAALSRPVVHPSDAIPGLVTAVVGVATLGLLVRLDRRDSRHGATTDREESTDAAVRTGDASRRGVLLGVGGVAVIAAASGYAGRAIARSRAAIGNITLPRAQSPAKAFPKGLDRAVPGITSFRTDVDDFYRVDTRLSLPIVDHSSWELVIDGDVARAQSLSYDDLLAMPMIERDITLTCVSNEIGGPYVGGARWLGVPLEALLDKAGVGRSSDQILSTDVDGMTISTPLALATDGRDAMIAVGMNGEPLPRAHGFPARMVVPGLYGFISGCKWINRMTLTTYDEHTAYWTERGWSEQAPIKIESRIDTPQGLQRVKAGSTFIGGIAWAQPVGVAKVEVQVDGGAWRQATLGPSAGNDYWRQWYVEWDAKPGMHQLSCRATDRDGHVQTSARTGTFPNGASGIQKIVVSVS